MSKRHKFETNMSREIESANGPRIMVIDAFTNEPIAVGEVERAALAGNGRKTEIGSREYAPSDFRLPPH